MDDRDRQHLGDLVVHAHAAIGYARAHGRDWWRNAETLDAVLMRISQIGEAAAKTSPEALAEVPDVTWRDVKGIRSRIVHDYRTTDLLVIRGVVSRQLPPLIASVRKALEADAKRRPRPEGPGGRCEAEAAEGRDATRLLRIRRLAAVERHWTVLAAELDEAAANRRAAA